MKKIFCIPVILLALFVIFAGCSSDSQPGKVDAEVNASALVSLADSHIRSYVNSMKALAMTDEVKSGDWEQMVGLLTEVEAAQIPGVDWFVLPDGSYYTVDAGLTNKNLKDRGYFPGLMDGNDVLGDLVVSKSTGKKSMIAAVPVVKDSEIIGGLGVSIFLDSLSELLVEQMDLPSDMVFYAVTDEGEVALHSNTELILSEDVALSEDVVSVTSELTGWEFSLGKADTEVSASSLVALTDSHIEGCVNSLRVLAMTAEVKSEEWEQMNTLLAKVEEIQVPSLVWFVLPDGSYYTVDAGLTDKNLADRAYFPGLMGGNEVLGDLVVGKTSGRKSLIAAVPVTEEEIIGGLGVAIYLDSLSGLLAEEMDLPADMVFYALTDDGEVALHSDTEQILADDPDLPGNVVSVTSELTGWDFSLGFK